MMMKVFDILLQVWHQPVFKRAILFFASLVPDKIYIQMTAKGKLGYSINLDNPLTFNEKLNWLKLYNRNTLYTRMADKYEAKQIVAERIGSRYVVRNLGCWQSFDDIDFDTLPDRFVLKCTHDSSGAIICRDKRTFDRAAARKRINLTMQMNYFYACREWPYKNIPHRIIADELLEEPGTAASPGTEAAPLNDYKFWCFNGVPRYMYCTVKSNDVYENFYDMDFRVADIRHGFPRHIPEFERPEAFDEMRRLAARLSEGIPFVRVDFFYVGGKIYFGEFTFFDWAGLQPFDDRQQDLDLGKLITLPAKR